MKPLTNKINLAPAIREQIEGKKRDRSNTPTRTATKDEKLAALTKNNPNQARSKLQEAASERLVRKMAHPEIY